MALSEKFLCYFRRSKDGAVSIEFALIFPLLITLYITANELTGYLTVARRAEMANNSMAQVLADAGGGFAGSMHHSWQIPAIVNPSSSYDWGWGGGSEWRNPFAFSKIIFEKEDDSCVVDCEIIAVRDFIFQFDLDHRECDVVVLQPGEKVDHISEVPAPINDLQTVVIVVGHEARYTPGLGAKLLEVTGDGSIGIKRYAYAVRHTGEPYDYPNNADGMYKDCS